MSLTFKEQLIIELANEAMGIVETDIEEQNKITDKAIDLVLDFVDRVIDRMCLKYGHEYKAPITYSYTQSNSNTCSRCNKSFEYKYESRNK